MSQRYGEMNETQYSNIHYIMQKLIIKKRPTLKNSLMVVLLFIFLRPQAAFSYDFDFEHIMSIQNDTCSFFENIGFTTINQTNDGLPGNERRASLVKYYKKNQLANEIIYITDKIVDIISYDRDSSGKLIMESCYNSMSGCTFKIRYLYQNNLLKEALGFDGKKVFHALFFLSSYNHIDSASIFLDLDLKYEYHHTYITNGKGDLVVSRSMRKNHIGNFELDWVQEKSTSHSTQRFVNYSEGVVSKVTMTYCDRANRINKIETVNKEKEDTIADIIETYSYTGLNRNTLVFMKFNVIKDIRSEPMESHYQIVEKSAYMSWLNIHPCTGQY